MTPSNNQTVSEATTTDCTINPHTNNFIISSFMANGKLALKDATPPALEKSPPEPNACDEGNGITDFPLLAGEPPGLAIASQP